MTLSSVFTKRAVAGTALRWRLGGIPRFQALVVGCNTLWVSGDPILLGEYPKGIPFFFHTQKGREEVDNWGAQGQGKVLNFPLRFGKSCHLNLPR